MLHRLGLSRAVHVGTGAPDVLDAPTGRCSVGTSSAKEARREIVQIASPGLPLVCRSGGLEVPQAHAAFPERVHGAVDVLVQLRLGGSSAYPEELHSRVELRGIGEGAVVGGLGVEGAH